MINSDNSIKIKIKFTFTVHEYSWIWIYSIIQFYIYIYIYIYVYIYIYYIHKKMPTLNLCVQIYMIKKTHKIIKSTNISLLFRSFVNRCIVSMYSQSNLLDRILRQHSYQPCPQDFFNNIQYNPHDGMLQILIGVI